MQLISVKFNKSWPTIEETNKGTLAVHRGTFMNSSGKSKPAVFVVKNLMGKMRLEGSKT
jgi:hypothetical protein